MPKPLPPAGGRDAPRPDDQRRVLAARVELRALRASWEYAFAHGAQCNGGYHPSLERVVSRERDLLALIQEHQELPET